MLRLYIGWLSISCLWSGSGWKERQSKAILFLNIGWAAYYYDGIEGKMGVEKVFQLLEKAALWGFAPALYKTGLYYYDGRW